MSSLGEEAKDWVISIVIALCGTICLFRTPVAEYPNITPVTITVSTT